MQKLRRGLIVGVVIGVPGESKESMHRTLKFLKKISEYDNFYRFEWGTVVPFPGSKANTMLRQHPALRDKYEHFGDENYTNDLLSMVEDWFNYYCDVDFEYLQQMQKILVEQGLVPYEMTRYQRRAWSGTPSKIFLE